MIQPPRASKALRHAALALATASSMVATGAHSAPIYTGVEGILWPAMILAAPVVIVHDLLFGSDTGAATEAEREATRILEARKDPISVQGLYTGALDLRWALYGMLVESRLPFVESDVAGSAWLLSLAKAPQPLIAKAQARKYIRVSLGKEGDPDCFAWQSPIDDWTTRSPVRPGTCMRVVFDDELRSNLQLAVDASRVSSRKLQWVVSDRATGTTRLAIPFWESQTKGQPLRVMPTYRTADENFPFTRVIRKLSPPAAAQGEPSHPYVVNRIDTESRWRESRATVTHVQGQFRAAASQLPAPVAENESWRQGYERASTTGKPVILNDKLLILPREDRFGPACANLGGRNCDFAHNFATDIGVLTATYTAAYEPMKGSTAGLAPRDMAVTVAGRSYPGELFWVVHITPAALPAPVEACSDFRLACYFYPRRVSLTDSELVVRGVFGWRNETPANRAPRDEYELVVPLAQLPPTGQP